MKTSMAAVVSFAIVLLTAGTSVSIADEEFFRNKVAPIFQRRCLSCHNDDEHKGDFSLQTSSAAFRDGYVEAGDAAASYLIELITPVAGKAKMPKNADSLTPDEIVTVQRWVDAGAEWPEGMELADSPVTDLNWWSLRPLIRPEVPAAWETRGRKPVADGQRDSVDDVQQNGQLRLRTPIDAFIQDRLTEHGLKASPEAERATLIRRLYFDLIGLPPTPEEVRAFVEDETPQAYEQLVDRLLDSNGYGERWARHWLDVVHYADTHG